MVDGPGNGRALVGDPEPMQDAERASRFLANSKACLDATLAGAVQQRTVWTELLWFATAAADLSPRCREELGKDAASLPSAALQRADWQQLQQELDHRARW